MWKERLSRWLLPGAAEDDPGFREQILRLGRLGLQVVGGVEIAVAAFMLLARLFISPELPTFQLRVLQTALSVLTGVISLGLARVPWLYRWCRALAVASGLVIAVDMVVFAMLLSRWEAHADDLIPGQITLIMFVGVVAIPFRPLQTLLFGFLTGGVYISLAAYMQMVHGAGSGVNPIFVVFIFMLNLLATGLTVVLYEQRRASYEAHLATLRAAEDLRQAEARNLLSQNAASVGRLAAALSHELNSPVGALVSGVDTLLLLAARQATAPPREQQRLVVLQADLRRSVRESVERLKELVARMQRFTNLDKAEVQAVNINDIVSDVAALLEPGARDKARLDLDLHPVPQLVCRPQQLSAVFSSLVRNAIDAVNRDGRVAISTRARDSVVEVRIEDNGRGLSSQELITIFDPGFKVARGRVSTGNWGMFSSRQIVREHGGEIEIQSTPGAGTRVCVTLPVQGLPGPSPS
ncbi:MAG: HAMP domain-containing histidine kinase [Acidobacteria bacterium]|nr:HAMP domain-containing histidine kinase [Acidobacteriota bacterium]